MKTINIVNPAREWGDADSITYIKKNAFWLAFRQYGGYTTPYECWTTEMNAVEVMKDLLFHFANGFKVEEITLLQTERLTAEAEYHYMFRF